jgi:hypothetical protein
MRQNPARLTLIALLALGGALALAGCGGEDSEFVETLCEPGEAKCLGNTVALCATDGKSWQYSPCGNQTCLDATCVLRKCQYLGGGICLNESTATLCAENGLSTDEVTCAADEVCAGGGCEKAACTDGDKRCGYRATLECVSGAWRVTDCPAGNNCDASGAEPACVAPVCQAQLATCDGAVSKVCNLDGSATVDTACGGNQICKGGYCQAKVAGVDDGPDVVQDTVGDTSVSDTSADTIGPDATQDAEVFIPPLEKISKIAFKLDGISNSFDLAASADYITAESILKVSAGKNTRKIEVNFAPIDPFVIGNFDDTDSSGVSVVVCYYDGVTPNPEVEGCLVGFSHVSTVYTASLTENNGEGSRVIGTFATTLRNANGDTFQITEGTFDVLHK